MAGKRALGRQRTIFVTFVLAALVLASVAMAWTPPPPRFADTSSHSTADLPIEKWEPSLGEPTSLLDVLPAGSPAVADYTGDGYQDLFVPIPGYTDDALQELRAPESRLYLNDGSRKATNVDEMKGLADGSERFIDVTDVAGIDVDGFAYSASWGDVESDGKPDLFVGGYRMARLYSNNGNGTFNDVTQQAGLAQDGFVIGAAWGDYDRDGHLDLFLVQFADYTHPDDGLPAFTELPGLANTLLRNDGDGTFTDVTEDAGLDVIERRSTSGVFVDATGDGLLDLYVTNYGEEAELWVNGGDGTFTEDAAAAGLDYAGEATCQVWEDVRRNGHPDVFIGDHAGTSALLIANGDGTYYDASGTPGLEHTSDGGTWGCTLFDYDNDGDMDLFVARSGLQGDEMQMQSKLLMNTIDGNCPNWEEHELAFMDVTELSGSRDVEGFQHLPTLAEEHALSGAVAFDWFGRENPGIMVASNDGQGLKFFRNIGWFSWQESGNYFMVELEGQQNNALGLGAKVTVSVGETRFTRQAGTGMSWGGQSIVPLKFGFGDKTGAVSVTVEWPDGQTDHYDETFRLNQRVRLSEGGGWSKDTIAPLVEITNEDAEPGKNNWYTGEEVTLHVAAAEHRVWESSGIRSMHVSTDGQNWQEVENPGDWQEPDRGISLAFQGEGTHTLWVETQDHVGNLAVRLYPVRIDTQPPAGEVLDPAAGAVYIQNEQVLDFQETGWQRSVILSAHATPDWPEGPLGGEPLPESQGLFGVSNAFPVKTEAWDNTSGVWKVSYRLVKSNNFVPEGHEATKRLAPYTWMWQTNETEAFEWRLETTVIDLAGHEATFSHPVIVIPTHTAGLLGTAQNGPSFPSLPPSP